MANRKITQRQGFIYGFDDATNLPIYSTDHGATWNAVATGSGGAFQISAGTGTAENISDSRSTPGANTVDGGSDGQFNAGVEPGVIGSAPYGTAADYATVGGGRDNYVTGEGSVIPGGQGNDVAGINAAAWGRENTAANDYGLAIGNNAVTRNIGERALALGVHAEGPGQERIVLLQRELPPGAGNNLPLYTDETLAAGTEEFETIAPFAYQVSVMVMATAGPGGTTTAAAWELRGLFVNNGTVSQIGATTTTFIANGNAPVFDTAPTLVATGSNIRVTGSDDGTTTDTVRWIARMVVLELPPIPGAGD